MHILVIPCYSKTGALAIIATTCISNLTRLPNQPRRAYAKANADAAAKTHAHRVSNRTAAWSPKEQHLRERITKPTQAPYNRLRVAYSASAEALETVEFDEVLILHDPFRNEESVHLLALVTLKLNHLAEVSVVDDSAITAELLLELLQHFLVVEALIDTLNGCQTFAAVTLLHANMNVVLVGALFRFRVGERVKSTA